MLGHVRNPRRFKPTGKGGGSRKGKPQQPWPLFLKVVAEAVYIRYKGSKDAAIADRTGMPEKEFGRQMDLLTPGWRDAVLGKRETPLERLLLNRVYKSLCYSGTSDRGKKHNPKTRAATSREDWRLKVPADHEYVKIHEDITSHGITTVQNWKRFLGED